ncbi:hypothetical protein PUNSTDRAFT_51100 [Punctularia strigosozonata HHB-11173 SS5]|uniref:uncharacterized protein n=1 Tax=Punctularia strigosozonata (strain HHB-11173) TaxID=741275 RepID=UPI0004416701|nr:uncharacterized protein PUNSTDRAFT_51100 [Punctularia strigosozonata HHB-11173 SS5]EIN10467.1 hypothetical protein PUNSTDRAFT_51100 [Punctularia strigosozonata HHB-11173 SS5]
MLSSYPKPSVDAATLRKLHDLSALISPEEGTDAHAALTRDMEDLVKLVEAVKLVDLKESSALDGREQTNSVPDGRIWPKGEGMILNAEEWTGTPEQEECGTALLGHASRTAQGLYAVDADRHR